MSNEPDIQPAIQEVVDRGEPASAMEPVQLPEHSRHRPALVELAFELARRSAAFRSSLPAGVRSALSSLVRSMNCYYSNLIEGHDTHPVDIERALRRDFSREPRQRDLQLEARAHVLVQEWIDAGALAGRAVATDSLLELHRRFCEALPDDMLWVTNPQTAERLRVTPGAWRSRDVAVGAHAPISPGAVPRFLTRLEEAFRGLGRMETTLGAAAAHHRLLWVHPFLDGNGRVARLMTHALLLDALESDGIWSVARGLARREAEYKEHLIRCDQPRRNDLDGRGALSEEALAAFTQFFLEVCLDQVQFMEGLVQPGQLRSRILRWAAEQASQGKLPSKAGQVLEAILYRGELPRAEVAGLLDVAERQGRRVVATLSELGVLVSETTRTPLRLAFPATLAPEWMPGLFPDRRRP